MARYTGPSCRLCRREGVRLFLKGDRCYSKNCAMNKHANPPGKVSRFRRKPTEYAIQLREKQKVKRYYGLLEKQFRKYFDMASMHKGVTGVILLQILERRLDNILYKAGLAPSRKSARQLVNHGHVKVNGRLVDIPSLLLKIGDVVVVEEAAQKLDLVTGAVESAQNKKIPSWFDVDFDKMSISVKSIPDKAEMDLEIEVNEQLIVELYSK